MACTGMFRQDVELCLTDTKSSFWNFNLFSLITYFVGLSNFSHFEKKKVLHFCSCLKTNIFFLLGLGKKKIWTW